MFPRDDWAEVLAGIQRSLEQTLAAVTVPREPEPEPPTWPALWQETSERLRQRLDQLDARAAQAKQSAQQLEALLTFEAESLNAWLVAAADLRQQLARSTARAIS